MMQGDTVSLLSPLALSPSGVLHVFQPLDPAGLEAGLAGVLLGAFVSLGLAGFAAFLLLAFGHKLFQSGEMPVKRLSLVDEQVKLKQRGLSNQKIYDLKLRLAKPYQLGWQSKRDRTHPSNIG